MAAWLPGGSRALQVGRGSVTLTVLAATTAIVAGTAVALLGFVFPELGDDAAAVSDRSSRRGSTGWRTCRWSPRCWWSRPAPGGRLPPRVLVVDSRAPRWWLRCVLLVAGPLVVLVGAELVPHVVTPCWAGEVPEVCEADWPRGIRLSRTTVHPFGHALLGWVPLTFLYVWALRRWWPEVVPRWVPGVDRRVDVLAGSDSGHPRDRQR